MNEDSQEKESYWKILQNQLSKSYKGMLVIAFLLCFLPLSFFSVWTDHFVSEWLRNWYSPFGQVLSPQSGISPFDLLHQFGRLVIGWLLCFIAVFISIALGYLSIIYYVLEETSGSFFTRIFTSIKMGLMLTFKKALPFLGFFILLALPAALLFPPAVFFLVPVIWTPVIMIKEKIGAFKAIKIALTFAPLGDKQRISSMSIFLNFWGIIAGGHLIVGLSLMLQPLYFQMASLVFSSNSIQSHDFYLSFTGTSIFLTIVRTGLSTLCIAVFAIASIANYKCLREP